MKTSPHCSVFGVGSDSTTTKKRIVSNKPATKLFTQNLPCLQDMLGQWWQRMCRSSQLMSDLT